MIMQTDFTHLSYLADGNVRQQRACELLTGNNIFSLLKMYDLVLVGTIPIGIDIEGSDLDIVCRYKDPEAFRDFLVATLGSYPDFRIRMEADRVVFNFLLEDMLVEIFATPDDPLSTNGYRHLLAEARILSVLGKEFREEVVRLKREGLKTEPAFARLLGLFGDPYQALLEAEGYSDQQIRELYTR
ncbi:MAG: DUF4269 domain-containing protein [Bacteroides sp.]|nr:DUF4269 domain-containing protein [Bacteroides sp.]